jgi:hypothetical protein
VRKILLKERRLQMGQKNNENHSPQVNEGSLPPPESHMSGVRYLVNHAHGTEYNPLRDYEAAKESEKGCVIFEGDYGGQIFLTCPMKYINCSHETLTRLLKDIDKICWDCNDGEGCDVFYEDYEVGDGVWGGMGGGIVINGLWIHPDIEEVIASEIAMIISGKKPFIDCVDLIDILPVGNIALIPEPLIGFTVSEFQKLVDETEIKVEMKITPAPEPLNGVKPSDIKEWIRQNDSEAGLAIALAQVHNRTDYLGSQSCDSNENKSPEDGYDAWNDLCDELYQKINDVLKHENASKGANHTILEKDGLYHAIKPFMRRYGYQSVSGLWVKEYVV